MKILILVLFSINKASIFDENTMPTKPQIDYLIIAILSIVKYLCVRRILVNITVVDSFQK